MISPALRTLRALASQQLQALGKVQKPGSRVAASPGREALVRRCRALPRGERAGWLNPPAAQTTYSSAAGHRKRGPAPQPAAVQTQARWMLGLAVSNPPGTRAMLLPRAALQPSCAVSTALVPSGTPGVRNEAPAPRSRQEEKRGQEAEHTTQGPCHH